jgi:hypothetical protein
LDNGFVGWFDISVKDQSFEEISKPIHSLIQKIVKNYKIEQSNQKIVVEEEKYFFLFYFLELMKLNQLTPILINLKIVVFEYCK